MKDAHPLPCNDSGCGWLHQLPYRRPKPALRGPHKADWVVVGAGYTGLTAASALARLRPDLRVLLVEADQAGAGASARNSGFLVDSTLNDGHLSDTGLQAYREKYEFNRLGLRCVERLVAAGAIDCGWNPAGKFHATANPANLPKLRRFADTLTEVGVEHRLIEAEELAGRLGTGHYRAAVYTPGGVLLQPAALARGLIRSLPESVELYEGTPLLRWSRTGRRFHLELPAAAIEAEGVVFAVNGYMRGLGLGRDRAFPLLLTASMTRPLTPDEFAAIGRPAEWGLLSAQPMGATLRLTADARLMIRNTAEVNRSLRLDPAGLRRRRGEHESGLRRRFPQLPPDLIESTWAGVTCVSANNTNLFERVDSGLYLAGCYNGGGIGLATLFGEQIAHLALGQDTPEIGAIMARPRPSRLPPQPFLDWGVRLRLARDRLRARDER